MGEMMRKYLTIMCLLGIVEITLALYLTHFREWFWNSVTQKDISIFTYGIEVFTAVALTLCVVAAYATYCGSLAAIAWRESLTDKAMQVTVDAENLPQRIQQDTMDYPQLAISIIYGIVKAVVYILVFSTVLCYTYNHTYLLWITLYALVATFIAKYIAVPLIHLNYEQQRVEATFRQNLTTFNFRECICIMLGLAKKTKRLNYFQVLYGQFAVVVPLLIIAPEYFTNPLMTLGMLISVTSIMSTILDNMSFLISSFNDINKLLSCKKRLKEINTI